MSRVISVANQKGGVGKTTTALNIGAAFVARGRRVLLIDMDPQECVSACLKIPTAEVGQSLSEVLLGDVPLARILVESCGMSLAPAGADLAETEVHLLAEPAGEAALREALSSLTASFDYVI